MIQVDNRAGSAQLAPMLRAMGVPVDLAVLPFGDASVIGSGSDGVPVSVGVEVKQIYDVLACIESGRYAGHQLPGMLQNFDQVWLLVIGIIRPNPSTGVLEVQSQRGKSTGYWRDAYHGRRRSMLYHDLTMWFMSMQIKGGVRLAIVDDYLMAAYWLRCLHAWWDRGWDDHDSHLVLHDSMRHEFAFDRALLTRPSLTRMLAAQLPSIGRDKSASVAARFKTPIAMVEASEADWQSIPGVGKTIAHKVYVALRGGVNGNGRHT